MEAVEQEQPPQRPERPPVTQLEFRQAMHDFKTMFPEMDEDVIEVVLRSNNGAVDSTIDQLLTMSTDNENEKIRTELDATENDELPPCYSPSTPPPSYNQAVPFTAGDSAAEQTPKNEAETNVPESVAAAGEHNVALKVSRNWKPPLIGELPTNFLKISGLPVTRHPTKKVTLLSSTLLQQRMEENEKKRNDSNDPELKQYLEDERIALFLQNEEFFQELKDNKEFLSTLQRDVSDEEEEEEAPEETDAAFREKLKNMGKVSRKKFTQLAKLFSRRKRRSFKPILGDGSNPSRDNLLEDEYSSDDEMNKKDTWNSHVGGPGGTIERPKMDS